MAEDYLLRFIEKSNLYQSGKQLYRFKSAAIVQQRIDHGTAKVTYNVPAQTSGTQRVTIHDFNKSSIYAQCNCRYEGIGGICEHIVAAVLKFHDSFTVPKYDAAQVLVPNERISVEYLRRHSSHQAYSDGLHASNLKTGTLLSDVDIEKQVVTYKTKEHTVIFTRKKDDILTACDCSETVSQLCGHKVNAFIRLVRQYGELPFEQIRDLTDEKNELLEEYGYTLADKRINSLFDFRLDYGELKLVLKDPSIHKIVKSKDWADMRFQMKDLSASIRNRTREIPTVEPAAEEREVPILVYVVKWFPHHVEETTFAGSDPFQKTKAKRYLFETSIRPVRALWKKDKLAGRLNEFATDLRYATFSVSDAGILDNSDSKLFKLLQIFQESELGVQMARKYNPNPGQAVGAGLHYTNNVHHINFNELSDEGKVIFVEKTGEMLKEIFQLLADKKVYLSHIGALNTLKLSELQSVTLIPTPAQLEFRLFEQNGFCVLEPKVRAGDLLLDYLPTRIRQTWLYFEPYQNLLILLASSAVKTLNLLFPEASRLRIRKHDLGSFLSQMVLPLMDLHNVQFDMPVDLNEGTANLSCKLYLTEATDKSGTKDELIFTPIFVYESGNESKELEYNSNLKQLVFERDKEFQITYRDSERENHIRYFFETLHPNFAIQNASNPAFFHLNINELFENEWFFAAFEKIKEQNIEIFGLSQLTKIKYNPNRAKMNIRASSGIDWFDLEMTISFGDQSVALKEVRKAIFNHQHYVKLSDGTLGILPQEWLDKYAAALKFGTVKGDKLKFSNLHFSLIEDLYSEIDGNEALQKLYEKKQLLKNFQSIADKALPKGITANLRPYQQSGYNWLNFLEEFKWGGILADDMGLGKTLQAISFLQHQAETKPDRQNLVIVPKSLVFNWQSECAKFAPDLKILIYYGQQRTKMLESFKTKNVIISTYGAVRSDIDELMKIRFNYIVLDESQAIKNPEALMSKAVKLLQSDNRFTLTGTPIENNTFDLYSQMDFLNPGMLGNMEFFKREFANKIDRDKDVGAMEQLRKLVYPFILRRTKEEVAKELPPKSESVIFCEMDKQQRRVYDAFRDKYRDAIMNRIDTDGMQNAAMYILEGLMKLRQICDSPAILNEPESYGNTSAKLDELIPRISEDSGRHKILVFSQFLEMLNLIQKELTKLHIPYEYLDGHTTDRMERVNRFQNNEDCRVFLMSLKAGGVGLNLTAADYVYIVDPWWNPAVEAQAIDRAHRIGQERPVFAYRMICKNTIEEKILELQDKKRALAQDLIHVETGFVKGLKREDVISLFS
jgi:SNF2 family DNA or RNA helicase